MLSHMHEVLGTRYCEPTAMKVIMTRAMQLIMKGTFNRADLAGRGRTGTRWQMLRELQREGCRHKLQDARGAPFRPVSSMISTPRIRTRMESACTLREHHAEVVARDVHGRVPRRAPPRQCPPQTRPPSRRRRRKPTP